MGLPTELELLIKSRPVGYTMKEFFSFSNLAQWLLVVFVSTPVGAGHAQEYEPYLEVVEKDSRFSIEAEDTSLTTILTELGSKAGFRIQDSGAQRPKVTSFQVKDATLETTLRKLLATTNHLIVYSGDGAKKMEAGQIDTIILMGTAKRKRPANPTSVSLAGPGGTTENTQDTRSLKADRRPEAASGDEFPEEELDDQEWSDAELARELAENPEMLSELDDDYVTQVEADSAVALPSGPNRSSATMAAEEIRKQEVP